MLENITAIQTNIFGGTGSAQVPRVREGVRHEEHAQRAQTYRTQGTNYITINQLYYIEQTILQ